LYNCILFDIDGTLLDTEKAVIYSLQKLLESEYAIKCSPKELSFCLGIPGAAALKTFNIHNVEAACRLWNQYIKEYYHEICVFPHLEEVVKQISQWNVKTGIVTSKTRQELIDDFYPFGLQNYFQYIICADDTKKHKPEPEPILKCLEVANASPQGTIYIGDTIYDMECAKGAGIDFALALWGAKNHDLAATVKLSHPKEILELIV
jgi:HAD superfamily hydrolase (TIGR01549 family)